jgi:hypothetical protein
MIIKVEILVELSKSPPSPQLNNPTIDLHTNNHVILFFNFLHVFSFRSEVYHVTHKYCTHTSFKLMVDNGTQLDPSTVASDCKNSVQSQASLLAPRDPILEN